MQLDETVVDLLDRLGFSTLGLEVVSVELTDET
jgi:hypothetical protein